MRIRAILTLLIGLVLAGGSVFVAHRYLNNDSVNADPFIIGPRDSIPTDYYASWSLFLACNPRFLGDNAAQARELFKRFEIFGWAIGPRNAAVWFSKGAQGVPDVTRNIGYCKRYDLAPTKGPYVLVITDHPDAADSNYFVMDMTGLDSGQAQGALDSLSDRVLLNRLDQYAIGTEVYWRTWASILNAFSRSIAALSEGLSLRIKTDFFELELITAPHAAE